MTYKPTSDRLRHDQEVRKAQEKYDEAYKQARTKEERGQALADLVKACQSSKKIETLEEGLAKIQELENEFQEIRSDLRDVKGQRLFLVGLAIVLDSYCFVTVQPRTDNTPVLFLTLLALLIYCGYRCFKDL
jgi:hypothetical protein